jgi:predicted transcriptional regulator
MSIPDDELIRLTAAVVTAHAASNSARSEDLSFLVASIYAAFKNVDVPFAEAVPEAELVPAVPVKKSIFPDYIVCLEDGKKLKTMKRRLQTAYGLTPDQYRDRWGLPRDYPMVAPNYAEKRSAMAKSRGFGKDRNVASAPPAVSVDPAPEQESDSGQSETVVEIKRGRGRPKKAA